MFHTKIYLDKSNIHGIGLFAGTNINKDSLIYSHNSELDIMLSEENLNNLEKKEKEFIMHHGYFDIKKNKWYLSHDNIRFCNHSSNPNMKSIGKKVFALKNIKKGQELTQDYHDFERPIRNSRKISTK